MLSMVPILNVSSVFVSLFYESLLCVFSWFVIHVWMDDAAPQFSIGTKSTQLSHSIISFVQCALFIKATVLFGWCCDICHHSVIQNLL